MENFALAIANWTALSGGATITGALVNMLKSLGNLAGDAANLIGLVA
ncbi:hypothetical protein QP446_07690 [Corynebacterium riegelii]|nr:hypothetical protein [Corynebacterium riegelii]MDK7180641.1 hypothetical protein [Corynebacterium riegelii]